MAARKAKARWDGTFREGSGTMAMSSGAYEGAYSAQSRFADGEGTNPEELIAAAHAGCFSMALSLALGEAGHPPESIETDATVHIVKQEQGFGISRIDLATRARVPGIDDDAFQRTAQAAKEGCPVSKALAAVEITLDATLED
jgi:osmotically inducible protein OsmC